MWSCRASETGLINTDLNSCKAHLVYTLAHTARVVSISIYKLERSYSFWSTVELKLIYWSFQYIYILLISTQNTEDVLHYNYDKR